MNRTQGTPLHRKHSNVLCNCPECRAFDNADTLVIENRRLTHQNDKVVAYATYEFDATINAETGRQADRQRIRGFHNATTTVSY